MLFCFVVLVTYWSIFGLLCFGSFALGAATASWPNREENFFEPLQPDETSSLEVQDWLRVKGLRPRA